MKRQLTELLTGYDPVGAVWFDGVWGQAQNPDFDWKLRGLYDHIHAIRPACLVVTTTTWFRSKARTSRFSNATFRRAPPDFRGRRSAACRSKRARR